jgi:hypothetical protein
VRPFKPLEFPIFSADGCVAWRQGFKQASPYWLAGFWHCMPGLASMVNDILDNSVLAWVGVINPSKQKPLDF